MPQPSYPALVLEQNNTHKSKDEIELRRNEEAALITGVPMQMQNGLDAKAKKEFERIKNLLAKIGKDDALYEGSINRYCELGSEIFNFKASKKQQVKNIAEAYKQYKNEVIDFITFASTTDRINTVLLSIDRQIQAKRKMMLDIEKEDIMTIASALRSIPKKIEKKENPSGMAAFMNKRTGGGA